MSHASKNCIPLYAEDRQFHLLKTPMQFLKSLRFLNKHLIFSEGFRDPNEESLRKFQTAGYLGFFFFQNRIRLPGM